MTAPVFGGRPVLVGHRGLGVGTVAGHAENSLASFLAAVEAGVDWVEVDVQRTADDELFVMHDAAFSDGVYVGELTGPEVARRGTLRLLDLLDALPTQVGVVFDVKSSLYDAGRPPSTTTAAVLARTCARALRDRPAVALSFDPAAVRHMRDVMPGLALGLLTWLRFPIGHAVAAAAHLDVQVLGLHVGSLWGASSHLRPNLPSLDQIVRHVHGVDRELLVWCPSERRARALQAAGADALVIDNVPRLVPTLRRTMDGGVRSRPGGARAG